MKPELKRGVEYLDKIDPLWHEKINSETLDINNVVNCVIGQLFGDWKHGFLCRDDPDHPNHEDSYPEFVNFAKYEEYGFYNSVSTEEWREFIAARIESKGE
jgi:hypothetical protein